MPITLNHTIVPSQDKVRAAEFFAKIFGLTYEGSHGHFAPVQVNDTLTLDYDDRDEFDSHHYAFHVSEEDFDNIFGRVKAEGITYGSGPFNSEDMDINHRRDGRGVYFKDPDGPSAGAYDPGVTPPNHRHSGESRNPATPPNGEPTLPTSPLLRGKIHER